MSLMLPGPADGRICGQSEGKLHHPHFEYRLLCRKTSFRSRICRTGNEGEGKCVRVVCSFSQQSQHWLSRSRRTLKLVVTTAAVPTEVGAAAVATTAPAARVAAVVTATAPAATAAAVVTATALAAPVAAAVRAATAPAADRRARAVRAAASDASGVSAVRAAHAARADRAVAGVPAEAVNLNAASSAV